MKRPRKTAAAAVEGEARRKAPQGSVRGEAGRPHDGAGEVREEAEVAGLFDGSGEETTESRYVPAAVQREVWTRDGGRCAWPTADGGVCGSTHRLQFDHVLPVAKGGESTVSNVRLACSFHNDLSARQVFGNTWMDRYTRGAGARAASDRRASDHSW